MLLWGPISLAFVLPGHVSQEEAGSYSVHLGLGALGLSQVTTLQEGTQSPPAPAGRSRCLVAGGVALDTQW